jgi:periplasmic protein TonB
LNTKIVASLVATAALCGCASSPMLECTTPSAAYPEAAKAQGAHGIVKVRIDVSETGTARNLFLVQSSGYPLLDQAALDSARAASCTPYHPTIGGDATAGTALVTYRFDLVQ